MKNLGTTSRLAVRRLESVLEDEGFRLSFSTSDLEPFGKVVGFARLSGHAGGFEQLWILPVASGDFVECQLRFTIVPTGNRWRGMFEETRFADPQGPDGLFACRDRQQAGEFLRRLAEAGAASAKFADECGPTVLQRTGPARAAAQFYLQSMSIDWSDLEASLANLKQRASQEQRDAVKAMSHLGLFCIPGDGPQHEDREFWAYQIAVYTIVMTEWNSKTPAFFSVYEDPMRTKDLLYCIQVLASQTFGHPLWDNMPEQEAQGNREA